MDLPKSSSRRSFVIGSTVGLATVLLSSTAASAAGGAITLSPTSGPVGTVITVTGTAFPKKTSGTVTIAGVSTSATTSASGWFSANVVVPSSASGNLTVTAKVGTATASAVFAVAAPVTTPPASSARLRFGVATVSGIAATAEQSQVASIAGESPSIVLGYRDFTQAAPISELTTAYNNGRLPLLTWEPWVAGGGAVQPTYALQNITAGNFDAYIQQWALDLKSYGKPVMLRFAHEMNGNWYPWSEQVNGNVTGDYVNAWRHVRDIFSAAGVTNVQWVWSPNVPYFGAVDMGSVYPGDGYVDIVALDGYNWGTTQTWGSSWQLPSDLFGAGLSALRTIAPGKEVIIAETASAEQGGSKADWHTALISYLNAQPDVTAVVMFDMNKEVDWRIDSTATAASAFATALAARK